MMKAAAAAAVLFLLASFSFAEEKTPASFTNKDLQKYESAPDETARQEPEKKRERSERSGYEKGKKNDSSKEHWCDRGTRARKKVEHARDRVREAEESLAEKEGSSSKSRKQAGASQKSLRKARERLKDAEDELAELEDEAHRKWVPPGWLRCQFE